MDKELKDQRIPIMMTQSEVEAIDDWSFKHRIRSRGEAIRRLCQVALRHTNSSEDVLIQYSETLVAVVELLDSLSQFKMKIDDGSASIEEQKAVEKAVEMIKKYINLINTLQSSGKISKMMESSADFDQMLKQLCVMDRSL